MIKTISIRKPDNNDLDYREAHLGIFKVAESWWCAGTGGSCSRFLSRSMHWLGGGWFYNHDVQKDKQDEMNEKDGELIGLLNLSVFGFSFFVVP